MLTIVAIVLFVLILAITLVLLYLNTDMFKSNSTLFAKYMGQNIENLDEIYHKIGTSEYKQLLEHNKYTSKTQVKVNYMENIGTSSEDTGNSINQLKLEINGQTDKNNQYNYQDIKLLNQDEKVAEVEYIQNQNTYGIKFSDLFNQYILVNNENLKDLFQKAGISQEQLTNLPDKIEMNPEWEEIFKLSKEEQEKIQTKYNNLISQNISKENFSKQKNQTIQIDGKNVNVNAYTLTQTKEKMNDLYLKILEEVKQEEIILSRLDKIQSLIEKYQTNETISLKDQFITNIDDLIANIHKNNIGQEEAKITVYENYHTTVRTLIQNPEFEIRFDVLALQSQNYMQISYKEIENEKEQVITYKKEKEETNISLKNIMGEDTKEYSIVSTQKVNGNDCAKTIIAKYEDDTNRVEATIEQEFSIINESEDKITIEEGTAINLSELNQEQLQSIINQVNSRVSEKTTEIMSTSINEQDLLEVLKVVGFVKEQQAIEAEGVTETEKNRFNSKFEILQGENLESVAILKLIDAIKDNLINIEVVSNTELKLKLDRLNSNPEVATMLTTFMEENKNKKYNVKVEYDEVTGLVNNMVLTMLEK